MLRDSIGKFWGLYFCDCLSERKVKGTKVTLLQAYCINVLHYACCGYPLFLHKCFFNFIICFACDGWQMQTMYLHQVLYEAR
jgi:hypothetical protein